MAAGRTRPRRWSDALSAKALAAARIPPERCGHSRTARLNDRELELYRSALTAFAETGRPSAALLRERAAELGLDAGEVLRLLAREDLIHLGADGEIAVAYPFSGHPTQHRVLFSGGHEAWAMCAIDALGMQAMLNTPIEVSSSDPISGEPVAVRLEPAGKPEWEPAEAVVLAGSASACDGPSYDEPSYDGCCAVLNFFGSHSTAERYLAEHPDVQGHPITIPEAVAAGTAIFGEVLAPRA